MSNQYRPSPFTSHPTVVMPDSTSETKPRRVPLYRWALYAALVLSVFYALWVWAR